MVVTVFTVVLPSRAERRGMCAVTGCGHHRPGAEPLRSRRGIHRGYATATTGFPHEVSRRRRIQEWPFPAGRGCREPLQPLHRSPGETGCTPAVAWSVGLDAPRLRHGPTARRARDRVVIQRYTRHEKVRDPHRHPPADGPLVGPVFFGEQTQNRTFEANFVRFCVCSRGKVTRRRGG